MKTYDDWKVTPPEPDEDPRAAEEVLLDLRWALRRSGGAAALEARLTPVAGLPDDIDF